MTGMSLFEEGWKADEALDFFYCLLSTDRHTIIYKRLW